jgi:hypothetical protein
LSIDVISINRQLRRRPLGGTIEPHGNAAFCRLTPSSRLNHLLSGIGLIPAAATAAVSPLTTTAASVLTGLGFVDGERSSGMFFFIQAADRGLSAGVRHHLDEPKALAPAAGAVRNDLSALDLSKFRKQLLQVRTGNVESEIATIQFLSHHKSPKDD